MGDGLNPRAGRVYGMAFALRCDLMERRFVGAVRVTGTIEHSAPVDFVLVLTEQDYAPASLMAEGIRPDFKPAGERDDQYRLAALPQVP